MEQLITINSEEFIIQPGLNKYALNQSDNDDIKGAYATVFKNLKGSFTTVIDNDTETKFNIAIYSILLTVDQLQVIDDFKEAFIGVQDLIDPERLNFNITNAADGEACINRITTDGIHKIIIHDDGLIALSFIGYENSGNDFLTFYEEGDLDIETITYNFFA